MHFVQTSFSAYFQSNATCHIATNICINERKHRIAAFSSYSNINVGLKATRKLHEKEKEEEEEEAMARESAVSHGQQ